MSPDKSEMVPRWIAEAMEQWRDEARAEVDSWKREAIHHADRGRELSAEVERLRKALESIERRGRDRTLTADQAFTIAAHTLASTAGPDA